MKYAAINCMTLSIQVRELLNVQNLKYLTYSKIDREQTWNILLNFVRT